LNSFVARLVKNQIVQEDFAIWELRNGLEEDDEVPEAVSILEFMLLANTLYMAGRASYESHFAVT